MWCKLCNVLMNNGTEYEQKKNEQDKNLLEKYEQESNHLQKLYKRRIIDNDGSIKTTIPTLMMPFSSPEEERMKGVFFNGYEIRH